MGVPSPIPLCPSLELTFPTSIYTPNVNVAYILFNSDVGEPLYLTPLIQQAQVAGNMTAVQDLARVTEPLPDLGTLIKEHYAGFLTVNETTNSNMFFWFFPVDTDVHSNPVIRNPDKNRISCIQYNEF